MNLRSIDLNLLVVLDALIELRSVGRAGDRLGLSQSATSHALDRLRKLLGDELMIRTAAGMEPTPRALRLAGPVRAALGDIRSALEPDSFDPASAEMSFVVAVETYETIVILPQLVDFMRREAPGVTLTVRGGAEDILSDIDQGRADLAIGLFSNLPERFMSCSLLSDDHVCAMRADHPLAAEPLTLERYLAAAHLFISMSGRATDAIDDALAGLGERRRIAMQLPNGLAAVVALARSDLIASTTRGVAKAFAATAPIAVVELPFSVTPTTFRLIWNKRLQASPSHAWLRRGLVAIGAAS